MPAFPVCSPLPFSPTPSDFFECSFSQSAGRSHAIFFRRPVGRRRRGNNNRIVMRRQLCVGLLLLLSLLLPALSPVVVVVATARRELPLMAAATGDEGWPQDVSSSGTWAPGAAEGGEEAIVRRRKDEAMKTNSRRFRRTSSWNWKKMPVAASQVSFGGRIPFTADYHSVHRHPPTHN